MAKEAKLVHNQPVFPGPRECNVQKNLTTCCFRSWWTGFTERYIPLQYYTPTEVHTNKALKNMFAVSIFEDQQ